MPNSDQSGKTGRIVTSGVIKVIHSTAVPDINKLNSVFGVFVYMWHLSKQSR